MQKNFSEAFKESLRKIKDQNTDNVFVPSLSLGNGKLKKERIASFGLVAGVTCPGAASCNSKSYCYAQNGRYIMSSAMDTRVNNYLATLQPYFDIAMVSVIKSLPKGWNSIRIHDSGDFYSQEYVEKWIKIMKMLKSKFFYAYTKSLHLDLSELMTLENALIIQSEGGKHDNKIDYTKPHAKIFSSLQELKAQGYIDATESDLIAIKSTKIGLIAHGGGKSRFPP